MRCPRCHHETSDPVPAFCRACGAPLRLPEEPPAPPLSAPVPIDRRDADADPTRAGVVPPPLRPVPPTASRPAPRPPAARDELADLEASHWDLGRPVPVRPEPSLGAPAPSAAAAPVAPEPQPHPAPAAVAASPRPSAAGASAAAPRASPARVAPPAARVEPGRAALAHAPAAPAHAVERAPGVIEVHVRRAEPWRRAAAWAIDGLPFAAGGVALALALVREATVGVPGPVTGLDLLDFVARERVIVLSVAAAVALALAVYATLAHALAGATLGKRLLHLKVVGPDGDRPGLARSAARSALALVSAAALGLGFLLALFTGSGRALHDLLARTWVVGSQP